MTKSHQMQQLEAVLGSYGSDSARWPPADRAVLEAFIADDPDAAARLAEEASFDELLALAPALSSHAAERAKERLLARFDDEIAMSTASSATVVPFAPRAAKAAANVAPRSLWRELSVMAAALLIGFFTVSQGVLDGTSLDPSQLAATASQSTGDTEDVSAIALGTTGDENSEEDLL